MAVPSGAYRTQSLYGMTTDEEVVEHKIAILQEDEETHKERFYLDAIFSDKISGVDGAIGIVYPSSPNYEMHNIETRGGALRQGANGVYLNDAGLNTKGIGWINEDTLLWANNLRFDATFKSAYYIDTDEYGFEFRKVGETPWKVHKILGSPLEAGDEVTDEFLFDPTYEPGDNLQVRTFVTNAEGKKVESNITVVTLLDYVYSYDTLKRSSACSTSGETNVAIWLTQTSIDNLSSVTTVSSNTGIYFWKNIELTIKADEGWYMGLDEDKSFHVDSTGQVTHYEECPVTLPTIHVSVEQDVFGNAAVWATISEAQSTDITVSGRIDVHPTNATPEGQDFEILIPQGLTVGTDESFSMELDPEVTYYWITVVSNPTGYPIQKQTPITI